MRLKLIKYCSFPEYQKIKNIFLLETGSNRTSFLDMNWCSIESAAKTHDDANVYLWSFFHDVGFSPGAFTLQTLSFHLKNMCILLKVSVAHHSVMSLLLSHGNLTIKTQKCTQLGRKEATGQYHQIEHLESLNSNN